jgi:hypothetical protein
MRASGNARGGKFVVRHHQAQSCKTRAMTLFAKNKWRRSRLTTAI